MEPILMGLAFAFHALQIHAYIVPTGQMAPTIRGYHKVAECPKCGIRFAINASSEADSDGRPIQKVTGCDCAHCQTSIRFDADAAPSIQGADRILSIGIDAKSLRRRDVVLFQYPHSWFQEKREKNIWVSRVIGMPGETIAFCGGRAFVHPDLKYNDEKVPAHDIWRNGHMHRDDAKAIQLFRNGKFKIIRTPPELMLSQRTLVYDHAFRDPTQPVRWTQAKESGWKKADQTAFSHAGSNKEIDWLSYGHIRRQDKGKAPAARLVLDQFSFNQFHLENRRIDHDVNWVGDLMIDCRVTVKKPTGELWLDVSRAGERFQARFDLSTGKCGLIRVSAQGVAKELAREQTIIKTAGSFHVRFANFQDRLTLWIDDQRPFGDGVTFNGTGQNGPTKEDLTPVKIGSANAEVRVDQLQIWRDLYFSNEAGRPDVDRAIDDADPATWEPLKTLPVRTYYIQPKHYFVVGDNPWFSSDSRDWGVVPESLLRGRALIGYFPLSRLRSIR